MYQVTTPFSDESFDNKLVYHTYHNTLRATVLFLCFHNPTW